MARDRRELQLRRLCVHRRLRRADRRDLQLRVGNPGRVVRGHVPGARYQRRVLLGRRRNVRVLLWNEFVREGRRYSYLCGLMRCEGRSDGDDGRDERNLFGPAEGRRRVSLKRRTRSPRREIGSLVAHRPSVSCSGREIRKTVAPAIYGCRAVSMWRRGGKRFNASALSGGNHAASITSR